MSTAPPPVAVLRGHDEAVVSLRFFTRQSLASGGDGGTLKLWDLQTLRCRTTLKAHEKSILSITSISGTQLATTSRDGTIKLWDFNSGGTTPIALQFTGHDHFCNATALQQDRGVPILVAPGQQQSQILLWDTRSPDTAVRCISPTSADTGMVTSLATISTAGVDCSMSPWIILGGYEDGSVHIFDLRRPDSLVGCTKPHSEPVFALSAQSSRKGTRVVSGGGDATLQRALLVEDSAAGMLLQEAEKVTLPHPGTACIRHRADGRLLVSGHWDHTVRVFDAKHLKPLAVLRQHRDSVFAVDFADEATNEAVGQDAGQPSGDDCGIAAVESAHSRVGGVSGALFATGSKDCTIALWDLFADSYRPS